MKIFVLKKEAVMRNWYLVDAQGQVLGRLASRIARLLMGKHKPFYTPHVDAGDHVVVVNAKGIRVTGKKQTDKIYYHHSMYPGGLKQRTYQQIVERFPTRPLELAVKRMLPKNRHQSRRMLRLHIYSGPEHKQQAQKPVPIEL
ncbi:50S ribosomal protein L13 [candidate division WOR-3 bacterium JGI_Cruoil_03_51_56]|uniref:Large ribosomal subunit protein uL13 n=1 Tax=candidate division WOR-3 bacterium JGI_Cruoil_03_51_56 TaxID=1973747 RepID=A0A235BSD6_UNCW3|nr:MAG: 50S ribosomal protein L13 [candidate division WOR-3 bacterium JGI_Cruoil_03_51_56]